MYAVAELLQLTSLQVLHGSLAEGVDVSHWSSLRSLADLKLLPSEEAGLCDAQVTAASLWVYREGRGMCCLVGGWVSE